jgi:hypothetical protein
VAKEREWIEDVRYDANRVYISCLAGKEAKILDTDAAGVIMFQLKQTGFNVQGFELSAPRAGSGEENLGVSIFTAIDSVPADLDMIFSSHVIEHLHSIPDFLGLFKKKT